MRYITHRQVAPLPSVDDTYIVEIQAMSPNRTSFDRKTLKLQTYIRGRHLTKSFAVNTCFPGSDGDHRLPMKKKNTPNIPALPNAEAMEGKTTIRRHTSTFKWTSDRAHTIQRTHKGRSCQKDAHRGEKSPLGGNPKEWEGYVSCVTSLRCLGIGPFLRHFYPVNTERNENTSNLRRIFFLRERSSCVWCDMWVNDSRSAVWNFHQFTQRYGVRACLYKFVPHLIFYQPYKIT